MAARVAEVAREKGAPMLARGTSWDANVSAGRLCYSDDRGELDLPLPRLPGAHQVSNVALAVAMLRHQDRLPITEKALAEAMACADWPARLQHLAPGPLVGEREVWLDGGHNPSASREIAEWAIDTFRDGKPLHLVFASLATKDPAGMLQPFKGIASQVHMVPIPDHACVPPDDLLEVAKGLGMSADTQTDAATALASIPVNARVLIFGSLYLAGAVLAANDQLPD
jgi:dihydrofolate synthase / folylpolyglutamate synthase